MNEPDQELIVKIREQLNSAKQVLIISHQRPDGDAIGSLLAMGLALISSGKDVQMVLKDGIPENFRFLKGSELVIKEPVGIFDYVIVVDSAEVERTNTELENAIPDLNIDHHKTNTFFAKDNLVESEEVATAAILAKYLPALGYHIDKPIANALLAGIVTDTIGFRTTNVNPQMFRIVADLMERGGELSSIYYRTLIQQSIEAARYWGAGLSKIKMEDGLVWTTLSLNERHASGYLARDDADLVKILSAIEGAKIAIILTEQTEGYVKISWRLCSGAEANIDVSTIAQRFGGGGHKAAAGADVKGKLQEVLQNVLEDTKLSMNHGKETIA